MARQSTAEPIHGEPFQGRSVLGKSVDGEPVHGRAVHGEPVHGEPVHGKPGGRELEFQAREAYPPLAGVEGVDFGMGADLGHAKALKLKFQIHSPGGFTPYDSDSTPL